MKKLFLITLFFAILIYGCGGAMTDVTGTWKKPDYKGKKFQNILIVAISKDLIKRSNVEKNLARTMKESGINATASTTALPPDLIKTDGSGKMDSTQKAVVKSQIESMGFDGIIVVSLLDIKDKQTYVPGQTYYAPSHYYLSPGYGYYNYWYSSFNYVQTPGYYVNEKDIFLSTQLFDVKTEELLWAAESETGNPSNISSLSASYSLSITEKMIQSRAVIP